MRKRPLDILIAVLKGMLVGLAVVIPGVSGGSMLLTIGVYEDAVSITSHDKQIRRTAIIKLIPYAAGIVIGVCALSFVITWLLARYEFFTILAFVGLILGSLPMLFKEIKGKSFSLTGLIAAFLMIALMIGLPYLNDNSTETFRRLGPDETPAAGDRIVLLPSDTAEEVLLSKQEVEERLITVKEAGPDADIPEAAYEESTDAEPAEDIPVLKVYKAVDTLNNGFVSSLLALLLGFIAAGTMIVPGISGSMVLLVLGFYNSIMTHLKGFITSVLKWNARALPGHIAVLLPFGIGVILGLLLVSKFIKWLLDKHPVPTYYAIIALMVTSPYAIFVKATCFGAGFAASLTFPAILAALVCLAGGFFLASRMNKDG